MRYSREILSQVFLLAILTVVAGGCSKRDIYADLSKPEVVVTATDDRFRVNEVLFDSDTVYVVASNLDFSSGSRWVIEPGTLIKVRNGLSVVVRAGARIEARGTADAPVIFTSAAAAGSQGAIGSDGRGPNHWNGLHIYGAASVQPGTSSGVLTFVRVEFAGGNVQFNGLPSLLLEDVDSTTLVRHVQVSYSFNADAFRFRGGNVDAAYLVAYATNGRDFSLEQGYRGRMQHLLAYRHPFFPLNIPGPSIAGMLITGSGTNPTISNLTVLGPESLASTSLSYTLRFPSAGLLVNGGATFRIRNSVLMGFPQTAFHMGERQSAIALQQGRSEFTHNIIHSYDLKDICRLPSNVFPPFGSEDFRGFVLDPAFNNQLFSDAAEFQWTDPYQYDAGPKPEPLPVSKVLTGADFSGIFFGQSFFQRVTYIGALGVDTWLNPWTNFTPLQTRYNQ
jgi:hypothetical protein